MKQLRIGTRGSKLALWQARLVQSTLNAVDIGSDLVEIKTDGDLIQDVALHQMGTTGIFTKALDQALLNGEIDIAVHSAKDMPSQVPEGLEVVAFLKREDPRDVFLAPNPEVNLENFSKRWVVGTSSVRRQALLRHYFSHVQIKEIRGNLDTRIEKMLSGSYDGLILAFAGVKRMGLEKYVVQKLNPGSFCPAVGQGAIAVVGRRENEHNVTVGTALHHKPTGYAVTCERSFLHQIEGGCHTPAFGLATVIGDRVSLTAGIAGLEGEKMVRKSIEGNVSSAQELGRILADQILESVNNY